MQKMQEIQRRREFKGLARVGQRAEISKKSRNSASAATAVQAPDESREAGMPSH
jgi:hypothetical protein